VSSRILNAFINLSYGFWRAFEILKEGPVMKQQCTGNANTRIEGSTLEQQGFNFLRRKRLYASAQIR
jgi:hypothetical protein